MRIRAPSRCVADWHATPTEGACTQADAEENKGKVRRRACFPSSLRGFALKKNQQDPTSPTTVVLGCSVRIDNAAW